MAHGDPNELRDKLASTIKQTWTFNLKLEQVVADKPRGVRPEITSAAIEAPLAWNSRAAYLILELHAEARRHETRLLPHVTEGERIRGDSDTNTHLAIDHLIGLVEVVTDDVVLELLRWFDNWCTRAKLVLGLVDPIVPLTQPDATPVRCPWCTYLTLRVKTMTATACCVNPVCRYSDEDTRRPQGRVETDPVTGIISIYWHGELPEEALEAA